MRQMPFGKVSVSRVIGATGTMFRTARSPAQTTNFGFGAALGACGTGASIARLALGHIFPPGSGRSSPLTQALKAPSLRALWGREPICPSPARSALDHRDGFQRQARGAANALSPNSEPWAPVPGRALEAPFWHAQCLEAITSHEVVFLGHAVVREAGRLGNAPGRRVAVRLVRPCHPQHLPVARHPSRVVWRSVSKEVGEHPALRGRRGQAPELLSRRGGEAEGGLGGPSRCRCLRILEGQTEASSPQSICIGEIGSLGAIRSAQMVRRHPITRQSPYSSKCRRNTNNGEFTTLTCNITTLRARRHLLGTCQKACIVLQHGRRPPANMSNIAAWRAGGHHKG